MSPRANRARRRGRGQTVVEFALILPVFLVATLAVVDGSRVFTAQIELTNGVRNAVLFAYKGNYNAWCRNPADAAQADPGMPVTVACPAGATAANYAPDPASLAYRIAAEASGMDRTLITLSAPLCGLGPGAPSSPCASVASPKYVTVTATYRFTPLTPLLSQFWGGNITLTATSTARVDM
ncbi:MAG TPA: TadE family protein [Candidatus Limnocylindria bacterium]|nr:TadE family protein [Candidatus Limnocylindria bacterium]